MNGVNADRIAVKLVFWLVVMSSVLTLVCTATELYFDYHGRIERLTQRLGDMTESCVAEVRRVVDAGDPESINVLLKNLLRGPIAYAAVIVDEKVAYEEGDSDSRYKLESSLSLLGNQQRESSATMFKVVTDIAPIRADISQKFIHSLIANGIKIFIIAAFIFLMFQYLVTRHLEEIVKQIHKEGSVKDLRPISLKRTKRSPQDELDHVVADLNSVREKRQSQHKRELLAQAVDQSPVMILVADNKNKIEYANPATLLWSGYSKDELLGHSFFSLVTPATERGGAVQQLEEVLQNGQRWEGTIRANSKWGVSVAVYCVISTVFDSKSMAVKRVAVCKEVSNEAALQDELLNSKKMEAVGRLSAKFAHEFGNPLFGVRAVIKDISARLSFSKEDETLLQLANNECDKMRAMVREFQEVFHESKRPDTQVAISTVIASVVGDERSRLQASHISCSTSVETDAAKFMVSKNKLTLVLRNIILNSIDAMQGVGGCLKITGTIENEFLVICISDSGRGIQEEYQELVLEPFFSTKPEVEGAGLGLSVAYGTMKSIGGTITFSSVVDKGSHFFVRIPSCC